LPNTFDSTPVAKKSEEGILSKIHQNWYSSCRRGTEASVPRQAGQER
jgi:hypothetical protein